MTHITCRLTAKNRDQLRNITLGNRVWLPFLVCNQIEEKSAVAVENEWSPTVTSCDLRASRCLDADWFITAE